MPSSQATDHNPVATAEMSSKDEVSGSSENIRHTEENPVALGDPEHVYLKGIRFHLVTLSICLSLFLAALDLTIVGTSLISITNDLGAFNESSWIVTSYLLTYTGFLIVSAKLSDIYGRRNSLIVATVVFVIFSGACAGAQTTIQLIIFRALQGIGGSGMFSIASVVVVEMVPPPKLAAYNGTISSSVLLSFVLGPVIGGAVNNGTTWRWIFIINVPVGIITIAMLFINISSTFPYSSKTPKAASDQRRKKFQRIDIIGVFCLLGGTLLLATALQIAGVEYDWSSAAIILMLVFGAVSYCALVAWQAYINGSVTAIEPIFSWRFMRNRVMMGMFLNALLAGVPFTVMTISLPQKFQLVNDATSLEAGVRLLPFSVAVAVSSISIGIFITLLKLPHVFVMALGTVLQILGLALLHEYSTSAQSIPASNYVFQVIIGLGAGYSLTTLLIMMPFIAPKGDIAVGIGTITQCRTLGGALGMASVTSILNSHVNSSLRQTLSLSEMDSIQSLQSISELRTDMQPRIREVFAEGYDQQLLVVLGFSAAEIIAIALMWRRKQ